MAGVGVGAAPAATEAGDWFAATRCHSEPTLLLVPPRQRSIERVRSFDPDALRRLRRERGLSLDRLAERIASSRPQLINYEQGRTIVGVDTLAALAEALEVEPLDLMAARRETATLADLRQSKGLTKAMLAQRLGMPLNTFASIESGRRTLQPGVAQAIARELDATMEEIQAAHQRGVETPGPTP